MALWYCDNTASGTNAGTSWVNAWQSFAAIVWASLAAGDTLYISGGSTTKTYSETLTIGKSGSAGNVVTISRGIDIGHAGQVIINGPNALTRVKGIDASAVSYVTVTGVAGQADYQGNISTTFGIKVQNFVCNTSDSDTTGGSGVWGGVNMVAEYIEFSHCMNGFYCASQSNQEIRFCYLHDIEGDYGMRLNNSSASSFSDYLVHHNVILVNQDAISGTAGADGIQTLQSLTIYNNTIRSVNGTIYGSQHADAVQIMGKGWVKFYNNYCANGLNSCGKFGPITGSGVTWEETYIFNNVFCVDDPTMTLSVQRGLEVVQDGASVGTARNIFICNNTFVDIIFIGINGDVGDATTVTNVLIENNIFKNVGQQASGTCVTWDNNSVATGVTIDYNDLSAGAVGGTTLTFNGSPLTQTHNRTGTPAFTNYVQRNVGSNFVLLATDTACIGQGVDLSSLFTTDANGLTRSAPWTIGAYLASTTQLPGNPGTVGAVGAGL